MSINPTPAIRKSKKAAPVYQRSRDALATVLAAQTKLGMSDAAMSRELGYSNAALGDWRQREEAPKVAGLAASSLLKAANVPVQASYLLLRVNGTSAPELVATASGHLDELSLAGKRYLLVPIEA